MRQIARPGWNCDCVVVSMLSISILAMGMNENILGKAEEYIMCARKV